MRVRTPAIRCDRPTIQGLPAFSPAQCPRVGGKLILPQRTFSCDAKDHARLRKYLGQNTFSKHGVQVELEMRLPITGRSPVRKVTTTMVFANGRWTPIQGTITSR